MEGSGLGLLRDPSVRVLRRGHELVAMTPEIRQFLKEPVPLIAPAVSVESAARVAAWADGLVALNQPVEVLRDVVAAYRITLRSLARRYLGDPRYPVGQVATLLGFAEASAFSRWFGAQFGCSPRQWRTEPRP